MAVWSILERSTHKEVIVTSRSENLIGHSCGEVEPDVDSQLLKEFMVINARPGDILFMDGNAWLMQRSVGVRLEDGKAIRTKAPAM